jgi:hypothetical protein
VLSLVAFLMNENIFFSSSGSRKRASHVTTNLFVALHYSFNGNVGKYKGDKLEVQFSSFRTHESAIIEVQFHPLKN